MSATQDLRSCLLSLCEIIENILPNLQKGIISPELFRLAKQDDLEAVKVKILPGHFGRNDLLLIVFSL